MFHHVRTQYDPKSLWARTLILFHDMCLFYNPHNFAPTNSIVFFCSNVRVHLLCCSCVIFVLSNFFHKTQYEITHQGLLTNTLYIFWTDHVLCMKEILDYQEWSIIYLLYYNLFLSCFSSWFQLYTCMFSILLLFSSFSYFWYLAFF